MVPFQQYCKWSLINQDLKLCPQSLSCVTGMAHRVLPWQFISKLL